MGAFVAWWAALLLPFAVATGTFVLLRPAHAIGLWLFSGPLLAGIIAGLLGGGVPALTPDRVVGASLVAFATVLLLARRTVGLDRIEWVWILFGFISLLSLMRAGASPSLPGVTGPTGGVKSDIVFLILAYGLPACGYFAARRLAADGDSARTVLRWLACTGALLALAGIVQSITGTSAFASERYAATTDQRAVGTMSSPAEFGLILCATTVAALMTAVDGRGAWRLLGVGAAALGLIAIVLSRTRAAWLGALIAVGVVYWALPRMRAAVIGGFMAMALLIAAIAPFVIDLDQLAKRATEKEPIYNRIALGVTAINGIASNPVLGVGFGRWSFMAHKKEYIASAFGVPGYWALYGVGVPHSEPLHILWLVGFVGLVPWLLAWIWAMRSARTAARSHSPFVRTWGVVALAQGAVFLFTALTLDSGLLYFASLQVWVCFGVLAGLIEQIPGGGHA